MSYKNRLKDGKKSAGFTIIEVLIVLAIAGLILLIVFLAVPALQRNSRNTTAKNDVQNVLGGIAEYQGANNGKLPTGVAGTGSISYTGATGTTPTSINIQGTTVVSTVTTAPTAAGSVPQGEIRIVLGKRCDGSASTRSVSAYYVIETSAATSSLVPSCQES
jgi:prepilin-type N-terminal cleavage/methylation domain-containing protein